jgi:N-acetylmuramoyl-L-alanine amidase
MPLQYDDSDLDSLALCVWKEARGEGIEGMRAVAHVILNRAVKWYGGDQESVHTAVYAKNQFTSMSVPSDPQFDLEPGEHDLLYLHAVALGQNVLNGTDPDPTNGGLYYANLAEATSQWFLEKIMADADTHPQTAVIGHHTFYA